MSSYGYGYSEKGGQSRGKGNSNFRGGFGKGRGKGKGYRGDGKGQGKDNEPAEMVIEDAADLAAEQVQPVGGRINFCKFFLQGQCNNGVGCKYPHDVQKLGELSSGDWTDCVINDIIHDTRDDKLYVASSDAKLRVFHVVRATEVNNPAKENAHMSLVSCMELPDGATSLLMLTGETPAVLVGLANGLIRVFPTSGSHIDLTGHTAAVHCMLQHQDVVITGSWDGTVRLWQRSEKFLDCTHVLPLPSGSSSQSTFGPIKTMRVFDSRVLWVAGLNGLAIVELDTLQIKARFNVGMVMGMIPLDEAFMMVAGLEGTIRVMDISGHTHFTLSDSHAISSAVCMTSMATGKLLVAIGTHGGNATLYELPAFHNRGSWFAHEKYSDVRVFKQLTGELFVTGGSDGGVTLWKLCT